MLRNDLKKITDLFFTSRVRLKIMTLFYTNPKKEYHMREIARLVDEQINAVRRELISMEKTEFLLSRQDGIKKFFLLNPEFPFIAEFRSIIMKSFSLGYHIFKERKNLGNLKFVVLSHTYLSGEKSDQTNLDMLVVGDPELELLDKAVKDAQEEESKEIFYTVMNEKDFEVRKRRRDPLIYSLTVLPRSMLLGTDEEFVV
jgi:hypothetical protein